LKGEGNCFWGTEGKRGREIKEKPINLVKEIRCQARNRKGNITSASTKKQKNRTENKRPQNEAEMTGQKGTKKGRGGEIQKEK
jgi:hypothetical protein